MRLFDETSLTEVAEALTEQCPVYQDDGMVCEGYGEGPLCGESCRYYREAQQILKQPGKNRLREVEGYEFPEITEDV